MNNHLNQVGVVFLTWQAPETLRRTLDAFTRQMPVTNFVEAVVYCQDITEEDRAIASAFGFQANGNNKNVGILGGMKEAVESCSAEIILYLECDCLLIEGREKAAETLSNSAAELSNGTLDVVRLRHLKQGGEDYTSRKHLRYWPDQDGTDPFISKLRRTFRPDKASRLIGEACLVHERAEERFPNCISRLSNGSYRISSKFLNWTNQSIMFRRDWFLDTIIPYAEAHPSSRAVNGSPDLEKEMNCRWWRQQAFQVGWADPGLFTHARLDRPEGDEKLKD